MADERADGPEAADDVLRTDGPLSASDGPRALFEETRARVEAQARLTPLSTYRLQFHPGFRFADASRLAPYLARLGVSHVYASPYLKAAPGSTHGYDVIDHQHLNPEVGTEEEHAHFCACLREQGLGQVLDVVPNHMGIEQGNPLWQDVLENGPSSLYAKTFDIDWRPFKEELQDKVLLPILGDQYGVVLEKGELRLELSDGAFFIRYYEKVLPVAPTQYAAILSPGVETLSETLGPNEPAVLELLSILTSLKNLPLGAKTPEAIAERHREKEVVKRRLAAVLQQSPDVARFVEGNVARLNGTVGDPRSFDALDGVLAGCAYRLAHWRVAGEEINYRRFFDINSLAAIRVEDPEVFEEAHAKIFRYLGEGKLQGLRIDHPDGLFDPTAYFLNLQERYFLEVASVCALSQGQPLDATTRAQLSTMFRSELALHPDSTLRKALYVVVEKIQGGRERIPEAWAVHGTTGYRFANGVTGLFVDRAQERALTATYERFIGQHTDFEALVYEKKRLILGASMSSEVNVLARELNRISELNRRSRDFTLNSLRRALVEFIALFPVYRTYVDDARPELDDRDVRYIEWTLRRAKQRNPTENFSIFDFLGDVLQRRYPEHTTASERAMMLRFAMKVQQITGPVMAKGLEDTVFYLYNRLVALNEVGGEPERFGLSVDLFHLRNQERAERWPASMLASSTHDTKRSEDVRARLCVLTELPEEWREHVRLWARMNRKHKVSVQDRVAPDANEEYLYYQTLVGAWPMGEQWDDASHDDFVQRVRAYLQKAIKEAKLNTSWTNPDPAYEQAVDAFVTSTLSKQKSPRFLESLIGFKRRIERAGQVNSVSGVVLKLACPGTPDVYQGTELWDLSLVDPDNRRPVDYAQRERWLTQLDERAAEDRLGLCRELWTGMDDGRIKLYVLAQALRLRRERPELFRQGDYAPLEVRGAHGETLVAFIRRFQDQALLTVVPRLVARALESREGLAQSFQGSTLFVPSSLAQTRFRDVFSGRTFTPTPKHGSGVLDVGELFAELPWALLVTEKA
jgi:(1->4)-alpha-D-glucan 1-alpha-D-glucosylmutase